MTAADIKSFYDEHIKPLSIVDRRRLLTLLRDEIEAEDTEFKLSILDLEGLGADLWHGIDAQAYVDELRDEWNHRS